MRHHKRRPPPKVAKAALTAVVAPDCPLGRAEPAPLPLDPGCPRPKERRREGGEKAANGQGPSATLRKEKALFCYLGAFLLFAATLRFDQWGDRSIEKAVDRFGLLFLSSKRHASMAPRAGSSSLGV